MVGLGKVEGPKKQSFDFFCYLCREMAASYLDKLLRLLPFWRRGEQGEVAQPLPYYGQKRLVRVFVEGYDDVAFWRSIFDNFHNPYLRFEISVPNREDLPKGKKVLLSMLPSAGEDQLLCMDSDFDFLFGEATEQSKVVNSCPFLFHTYSYATENYLCYAPSLHNVCVKATKNDTHLFNFEHFMAEYSCIIYPAFLWYIYSAREEGEHLYTLIDFKQTVRLGYLDIRDNGAQTLAWLKRKVEGACQRLSARHPELTDRVLDYGAELAGRGLRPDLTYLFMHGHTLLDHVVMPILQTVCEHLRRRSIEKIHSSKRRGVAFNNEIANYKNAQRSIREVLLDNDNYTSSPLYQRLHRDIEAYISQTVERMRQRGEIEESPSLEAFRERMRHIAELP